MYIYNKLLLNLILELLRSMKLKNEQISRKCYNKNVCVKLYNKTHDYIYYYVYYYRLQYL